MKFKYGIYYSPSNTNSDEIVNFVCFDNKIHIRFKDYNSEEVIVGFEKKLTYLLTYLMNYSYLSTLVGNYSDDEIINNFLTTKDVLEILDCIKLYINDIKIKGIKLNKNYNRKTNIKSFGDVNPECFPLYENDGIVRNGNLKLFLKTFKITLNDYLFNDDYVILILKDKEINVNKKFIDRMNRRLSKVEESNFNITELW